MKLDEVIGGIPASPLTKIVNIFTKAKFTPKEDPLIDTLNKYGVAADVDTTDVGLYGMLRRLSKDKIKELTNQMAMVTEAVEEHGEYKLHRNNVNWSWDVYKGDKKVKSFSFTEDDSEKSSDVVKQQALEWIQQRK
jgi:hypothetical protein